MRMLGPVDSPTNVRLGGSVVKLLKEKRTLPRTKASSKLSDPLTLPSKQGYLKQTLLKNGF